MRKERPCVDEVIWETLKKREMMMMMAMMNNNDTVERCSCQEKLIAKVDGVLGKRKKEIFELALDLLKHVVLIDSRCFVAKE